MKMRILYKIPIILIALSVIFVLFAIFLPMAFPTLMEKQLNKKLIISPDSEMLKKFQDPPVPLTFKIRVFNITNSKGVLQGEKPKLQELGPYTYIQKRNKVNIEFDHGNGTVKYNLKKQYYFQPELSKGSVKDLITTVNPVYMTFSSRDGEKMSFTKFLAMTWFARFHSKPFVTRTVGELLFDGYVDKILKETYKLKKEPKYKTGKFGYFYPKNGSLGDSMEIFTGELGMDNYQHIVKVGGKKQLNFWKEDRCNQIVGTDASQFPRPVTRHQEIKFFTTDLCRSIYGVYEKDVYLGPLKLHRFVLPAKLLAKSPENNCYCPYEFSCRTSMIDVSACRGGAPIVVSTPHFYQGDEKDIQELDGLRPLKELHETYLDVEPTTGVTLRANKRIQVNIAFRKYGMPSLSKISEVIMPVFWVSESAQAPSESVEKLYTALTVPEKVVSYACYGALAAGLCLLFIGLLSCCIIYRKQKELIPSENASTTDTSLKG